MKNLHTKAGPVAQQDSAGCPVSLCVHHTDSGAPGSERPQCFPKALESPASPFVPQTNDQCDCFLGHVSQARKL